VNCSTAVVLLRDYSMQRQRRKRTNVFRWVVSRNQGTSNW